MKIITLSPKIFASNTYILISGSTAMLVDPSASINVLEQELNKLNVTPVGALLTHGHFDHITSIDTLRQKYNIPIYIHENDACLLTNGKLNGFYTFFGRESVHPPADKLFNDGDNIAIGKESVTVLHTPGHTQGSSCFIFKDEKDKTAIITGDTLFSNSVGRTDLYGGDIKALAKSIKKLAKFDKDATIYPGHNESSTIGEAIDNISEYF